MSNIGSVPGKEVVQVYTAFTKRKETAPAQELKGFEKVELLPGECKRVSVLVEDDIEQKTVQIGSSSRDIQK